MSLSIFAMVVIGFAMAESDGSDWMSRISDKVRLSSLTIPGTHNSAALREPLAGTAKCQTLPLAEQLDAGVRFFDLRCCHQEDRFHIYHGPISQKLTFESVLKTFRDFLLEHPRESLLISIKPESSPRRNSRSFVETLQAYIEEEPQIWHLGETIPTLGEVRGKLVLLRRFAATEELGFPATDWGHDGSHKGDTMFVQDRFEVAQAEIKWNIIRQGLDYSLAQPPGDLLHLHFTSGYRSGAFGVPNISVISRSVNQRLSHYLKIAPHQSHGCLVLDFITPDLARAIYQLNFPVK